MIGPILAAVLAAAPVSKASSSRVPQPTPPSKDVWLNCNWHETWKSSSSVGAAHSDSTSEHDYEKTYVFFPQQETFAFYDPNREHLVIQNAIIGASAILVDDKDHNETMIGETISERQWTVNRSDLSVTLFGHTMTNVRLDDGRIITSQLLMNGTGACVITDRQPLAQTVPNKF